jgi:DNA helicase-2/ATP-dependent DNA helicase PcrA
MPLSTLILGGPGCGKTTRLLDIVQQELSNGVEPGEIAYVAFTRAAANEARERAGKRFGLVEEEDLPWFRTIHSLAYRMLGMTRDEIVDYRDWKEFGNLIGEQITGRYDIDTGIIAGKKGDQMLRVVDYASTTGLTMADAFEIVGPESVRWHEMKRFEAAYRLYKQEVAKLDFTDLLIFFAEENNPVPRVRVAVIDEAQDLTPVQWRAVEVAFRDCERIYIGGDDDQAIYRWAGADINHFLSLSDSPEVLEVSHRLPRQVWNIGRMIAERISRRYKKPYIHADRDGEIDWHFNLSDVDLNAKDGT